MSRASSRLGFMLMALCCSQAALSTPLQTLRDEGHLQISSTLSPETDAVPGQKILLTLSVATDSWFTGGTQIAIPEVPGLVILQTEQFAANATEIRNGATWVVQRWTLDVFPQRGGSFRIPPIKLQLKVNAGKRGDLQGTLYSGATQLDVIIPAALELAQPWVAAPQFEVSQHFDRALEGLVVGDAFEQEVLFSATDLMAMMLPTYEASPQSGLATYPAPPVLINSNNRGASLASRSVRINYVVEAPGNYQIPGREYLWWNTNSGELESIALPASQFEVAGIGVRGGSNSGTLITVRQRLLLGAALVLALMVIWLTVKFLPLLPLATAWERLQQRGQQVRDLTRPALPDRLNPGSNAEDETASRSP